ncbi:MAG TPA: cytochrome c oxidase subunit 3 [Gammaproteobacteria bacterium]|jgi:cytochrome c oxidase subunit 3|nr:cytochrome c oxidase subunit 3 [Gammaproteobacteria bacterium]
MSAEAHASSNYYVPHGTQWPIIGSIGLFTTMLGAATWLEDLAFGKYLFVLGLLIVLFMMFGWFGTVIRESQGGVYNAQVDRSFRWGMTWFIFSEVMFFGAFFGALFYARVFIQPWLGGSSNSLFTNLLTWKGYEPTWPSNGPANVGGDFEAMKATGIAAINTLILLSSGVTVTIAHWGLKEGNRKKLCWFLLFTVILGFSFVVLQAHEYIEAYTKQNLTLGSGIYGSTFFMLTGFHGLHVTIGAIMLSVILVRSLKGHFTPDNHFAFEAVSWYWHFVDVVWLGLYIFVYWL